MITVLTVAGNVFLAVLLVWRGFYIRYGWLTVSAILSIFCDVILTWCHGNQNSLYPSLWTLIFFLFLGINMLVLFEAFSERDRCVQVPVEFQLGLEIIAFLAKKMEFLWVAYYMQVGLRWTNLLMILFLIRCFLIRRPYESFYASEKG